MRTHIMTLAVVGLVSGCDRSGTEHLSDRFGQAPQAASGEDAQAAASASTTGSAAKAATSSPGGSGQPAPAPAPQSATLALADNAFMMKNFLQLQSALDSCLGPGLGTITNDMFGSGTCPNTAAFTMAADKTAILSAAMCADVGQNILEVDSAQLWDPSQATRTVTLANNLTAGYLTALAQVADVYAHGLTNPQSLCGTAEQAQALVQNCLGQFDPSALATAASMLQGMCAKGSLQARQAIATLIGSVAFASINGDSGAANASGSSVSTSSSSGSGT